MKRQRFVEERLPLDCWGMILLHLWSATDVLNLFVQCKAFYNGLKPVIVEWLKPRYHAKIEKVHKVIYMCHLGLLRRFDSYAMHSIPSTNIVDCWYVDPIKRTVVPLVKMNPMRVVFNDELIRMTREKLQKERPTSWRVLDSIMGEKRGGWRNIVFDFFGDQIWIRTWGLDDRLEDLMLGDQLLCQPHVSDQCITPRCDLIGVSRDVIEEHVIRAYKSNICYTRGHKLFEKYCDQRPKFINQ
jgi:hypothetical protein